jgi:hypothetical protein
MATTDFLDITKLTAGQASAEVTVNAALDTLDRAWDRRRVIVLEDEFTGSLGTASGSPWIETNGNGGDAVIRHLDGDDTHIGTIRVSGGTTNASGYATIGTAETSALILGNGSWIVRAWIQLSTAGSDGTPSLGDVDDAYVIRIGFQDTNDTAALANGVCFRYSYSINSGRWEAVTATASSETTADTGIAVALDVWYLLEIEVNADASSVTFRIGEDGADPVDVATITDDIPTLPVGIFASIVRSTNQDQKCWFDLDYLGARCVLTTPR